MALVPFVEVQLKPRSIYGRLHWLRPQVRRRHVCLCRWTRDKERRGHVGLTGRDRCSFEAIERSSSCKWLLILQEWLVLAADQMLTVANELATSVRLNPSAAVSASIWPTLATMRQCRMVVFSLMLFSEKRSNQACSAILAMLGFGVMPSECGTESRYGGVSRSDTSLSENTYESDHG